MSIVTWERYKAITGDETTAQADVEARMDEALVMLAEDLCRPIEHAERTEWMWADRAGWVWPLATPITAADGWTISGAGLRSGSWPSLGFDHDLRDPIEVTYSGGWVARSEPLASNALPLCMERDLAWAATALGRTDELAASVPVGATAVSVGDISVSFGSHGSALSADDLRIKWSRATLRYRHRRV